MTDRRPSNHKSTSSLLHAATIQVAQFWLRKWLSSWLRLKAGRGEAIWTVRKQKLATASARRCAKVEKEGFV
jgi:hypothetical protein